MRIVVLDTNVLLSDPSILQSFRDTEVMIPETVLGELDKLKTSRVDPDLKFRGRDVSRMLFELSEQGNLASGVELPHGGVLRVVGLDPEIELPEELSLKNADDRILAVALQACAEGCEDLVLITNDLNMLLKAQTLGVKVQRHSEGPDGNFGKRFLIRPFQRYKTPLAILAVALAVFAAIVFLAVYNPLSSANSGASVPQEFRDQLLPNQQGILDSLIKLQRNPNDTAAELQLANEYFDMASQGHPTPYATLAVQHYENVLRTQPDNLGARVDMAVMLLAAGDTDRAIQETIFVISKNPNHIQANYNLGIIYWQGKKDYRAAESQFKKVIELARGGDSQAQTIGKNAATSLQQVQKEAAAAGSKGSQPVPSQTATQ